MESNKYFEDDKNDDDEKFKEKPIKIKEGYGDDSEDNSSDRYLMAHAFEFIDEEFTDEEWIRFVFVHKLFFINYTFKFKIQNYFNYFKNVDFNKRN